MAELSIREETHTLMKTGNLLTAINPTSMDNIPITDNLLKKAGGMCSMAASTKS